MSSFNELVANNLWQTNQQLGVATSKDPLAVLSDIPSHRL